MFLLTIKVTQTNTPEEVVKPPYLRIYTNLLLKLGQNKEKARQKTKLSHTFWSLERDRD